jgi:hypothetical protein
VRRFRELGVRTVRLGLAGLTVIAIVVVLALSLLGGESNKSSPGETAALSESELLTQVGTLSQPAFWVGPRPGTTGYELTSTTSEGVYIRYLTGGARAGDPRPVFLAVGTYPVPDARKALQRARNSSNGTEKLSRRRGYELLGDAEGNNVYVVFDKRPELQIEITSPRPGEAAELTNSGSLRPLG